MELRKSAYEGFEETPMLADTYSQRELQRARNADRQHRDDRQQLEATQDDVTHG